MEIDPPTQVQYGAIYVPGAQEKNTKDDINSSNYPPPYPKSPSPAQQNPANQNPAHDPQINRHGKNPSTQSTHLNPLYLHQGSKIEDSSKGDNMPPTDIIDNRLTKKQKPGNDPKSHTNHRTALSKMQIDDENTTTHHAPQRYKDLLIKKSQSPKTDLPQICILPFFYSMSPPFYRLGKFDWS